MTSTTSNPFAPTDGGAPRRPRPPRSTWLGFAVQRGLRLVALPLFFTLAAMVWGLPTTFEDTVWYAVAAVSGLIWLPTTLWILHARFLHSRDDDRGVLLSTGEVLDRGAYSQLHAARVTEHGLLSLALLGTAAGFVVRFGWTGVPVLVVVVFFLLWTAWLLVGQVYVARAVTRMASGDDAGALRALGRARAARLRPRTADAMEALAAQAHARLGDPEAALAHLSRVRRPQAVHADIARAMVGLGRGEEIPAELVLEPIDGPGRGVGLALVRGLAALHRGDADVALAEVDRWEDARPWLPWRQRTSLDLVAAAAWQLRGEPDTARGALRRSGVALEDREAMGRTWPRWWALLQAIP